MTLCGCLTSILIAQKGIHTFAAIGLALVVSLLFGALNGALITKMRIPAFIATLATMNVLRGACYVMTNGKPVVFSKGLFTSIGGGYIGIFPLPAVYMVIAFAVLWVVLNQNQVREAAFMRSGEIWLRHGIRVSIRTHNHCCIHDFRIYVSVLRNSFNLKAWFRTADQLGRAPNWMQLRPA